MALAFLALCAMLGLVLLALAVVVGFIRGWQFSLKALLALATLVALLMLPIVAMDRKIAQIPSSIWLSFDGENQWVTPPLEGCDYWITLFYKRDEPGRLGEPLGLRLFDGDTLVLSAKGKAWPTIDVSGDDLGVRLARFGAIEGHRYRIEVDAEQAKELARYHHPRLNIGIAAESALP